jgi:hypothetical protein
MEEPTNGRGNMGRCVPHEKTSAISQVLRITLV